MITVYFGYDKFGHREHIGMGTYQTFEHARCDVLSSRGVQPDPNAQGMLVGWTYENGRVKQVFAIRSGFNPTV
jgi:hypothetical protein